MQKQKLIPILFVFLGLIVSSTLHAQDEPEINVAGVRFLDYGGPLPEEILASKSVVLLQMPPQKGTSLRAEWKPLATEAHEVFKKAGVDPVAYYFLEDVNSGTEVTRAFADEIKSRDVKYIIILSNVFVKVKGKESERFVIMVTEFNGTETLMSHGQRAWKTQNKSLDKALDKLLKETTKGRYTKKNLLISDFPELFNDFGIIKAKRTESYSNSLSADKVAFQGFIPAAIPADRPRGVINNNIAKEAERANASASRNNNQMAALLKKYPYEYGLVTDPVDEQALLNQGYNYIVYRLHTVGSSVRSILNYELEEGLSDYMTIKQGGGSTVIRSIPTEAPVFKFYLKHLRTNDVFVGSRWDADETWEEALKNFINNIISEKK